MVLLLDPVLWLALIALLITLIWCLLALTFSFAYFQVFLSLIYTPPK